MMTQEQMNVLVPGKLRAANDALLDIKVNRPEKAEIDHVDQIDAFLDEQMEALGNALRQMPDYKHRPWEPLNRFFLSELERMNG